MQGFRSVEVHEHGVWDQQWSPVVLRSRPPFMSRHFLSLLVYTLPVRI